MTGSNVECSSSPSSPTREDQLRIYLFARTDLQKEQWYKRLKFASHDQPLPATLSSLVDCAFQDPVDFNEKESIVGPY